MAPSAVSRFPAGKGAETAPSHRNSPQSNRISSSNKVIGSHPNDHAAIAHPAKSAIPVKVKIQT